MKDTRISKTLLKWVLPFSEDDFRERNKDGYNAYQKGLLLIALCFSVSIISAIFALITFIYKYSAIAVVDSLISFSCVAMYLYFRKKGNLRVAGQLIVLISAGLLIFLLINGGVINTGYMWSFSFPIMALLFNGSKRGSILSIVYLFIADIVLLNPFTEVKGVTSNFIFIAAFTGVYLIIFIMCFFFEYTHSEAVRKLKKQNNRLAITIADLNGTKRKLKKAHDELEIIFENSTTGIAFLKGGRKIAAINPRLCEMLGYESREALNQSVEHAHLSPESFFDFGENYFSKLKQSKIYHVELPLKRKDGKELWCLLSGSAINPNKLDDGVIWMVDDLTERKKDKEELLELERKTAILAMIVTTSHEINQPLTVVLGNINLLELSLADRILSEREKAYLYQIKNAVNNISKILKKYRDAESVEIGAYVDDVKMVHFPQHYGSEMEQE